MNLKILVEPVDQEDGEGIYSVKRFYGTYSEKVVQAQSREDAIEIAGCIATDKEQVWDNCTDEGLGVEVDTAKAEDLTELTADDKRNIAQYQEWQQSQERQQEAI